MLPIPFSNIEYIWLQELASTNKYATALLSENRATNAVIVADFQTSGKGQQNNVWISECGKNILMSWAFNAQNLKIEDQFYINKVITISIVSFFRKHFNLNAVIKWPNDIYIFGKKIAGILIENSIEGNKIKSVVVGLGININQEVFPADLPNATSVKMINKKLYDIKNLIPLLMKEIEFYMSLFVENQLDYLTQLYMNALYLLNEEHDFLINDMVKKATVVGVARSGQLIALINGEYKTFNNKEIKFLK